MVRLEQDAVRVGDRFSVAFERTLRIPEDGGTYPLPPGLGRLPVHWAGDFPETTPAEWIRGGDLIVPLYQREALWLAFDGSWWKPNAVQVWVGGINAVSGERGDAPLSARPQNYLVTPEQLWLDGVNSGDVFVRQFVAVPLGRGRTVAAQVSGHEDVTGVRIRVYEPLLGRFPAEPPPEDPLELDARVVHGAAASPLGIGAGGRIRQRIVPDTHGPETWDPDSATDVEVQVVNSEQYGAVTGLEPPPTPVSAADYTAAGLPWFELYDESGEDVAPAEALEGLAGTESTPEEPVSVDPAQLRRIERRKGE